MRNSLVFVLWLAASHVSGQGLILPPSSVVSSPGESISSNAKAFSGKWEGMWDGRMPHVLVVEEVKSNTEAAVVYAWQEPLVENAWGAGWYRTAAVIEGSMLKVPLRNGIRAWYELLPDGTLKAGYQRPNSSTQSNAVLRRVKP